jgi:hypothetical protein
MGSAHPATWFTLHCNYHVCVACLNFFFPKPVRGMSPIFFLAVQYNFDRFHHISWLLALSVLSVKLWYFWMWLRSISSASSHSGHNAESFLPILFRCRCRGEVVASTRCPWIDDQNRKSNKTSNINAMQPNCLNSLSNFTRLCFCSGQIFVSRTNCPKQRSLTMTILQDNASVESEISFQAFTAEIFQIVAVLWTLIGEYRLFGETCCLCLQG